MIEVNIGLGISEAVLKLGDSILMRAGHDIHGYVSHAIGGPDRPSSLIVDRDHLRELASACRGGRSLNLSLSRLGSFGGRLRRGRRVQQLIRDALGDVLSPNLLNHALLLFNLLPDRPAPKTSRAASAFA
jgi:hypothetical protein